MKRVIGFLYCIALFCTLVFSRPVEAQIPDTLYVADFTLTTDVINRVPVDTVTTFNTSDGNAYAFIRVYNSGAPDTITFKWMHDGKLYYNFDARVGNADSWRTFSSVKTLSGNWTVQIISPEGETLEDRIFQISE